VLTGNKKITGTVRDAAGEPVAGVVVTASPVVRPAGLTMAARRTRERPHLDRDLGEVARDAVELELWRRNARHSATTRADGSYAIEGLADLPHELAAFHERYTIKPVSQTGKVEPDAVVDFVARPAVEVRVEVRRPDGEAVESAWVSWKGPAGTGWDYWTPEPGTVRLPVGSYTLKAQVWVPEPMQSEPLEKEIGAQPPEEPLVLTLENRRVLTAQVTFPEGFEIPEGIDFRLKRLTGSERIDPDALTRDMFPRNSARIRAGRAEWYDLEPGRYLVAAFYAHRGLLAHAIATVDEGSSEVELLAQDPASGPHLQVTLLGPDGKTTNLRAQFQVALGAGPRLRYAKPDVIRRTDGTWLVLLPPVGDRPGDTATLRVSTKEYGVAQETFNPRNPGSLRVRFKNAAHFSLTVDGFTGSSVEGRLYAGLVGQTGVVAVRQISPDGSCDLAWHQPGEYSVLLFLRSGRERWPIRRLQVSLGTTKQRRTISVPSLHTLTVRLGRGVRPNVVVLRSSDPRIGQLRVQARPRARVATFKDLAPGSYTVTCSGKRLDLRVPAPGETVLQ